MRRLLVGVAACAIAILAPITVAATKSAIVTASPVDPALLGSISTDSELLAVAVSADGSRAAIGYADTRKTERRSLLKLYATDKLDPPSIELPGMIRDLLFASDGSGVYVILFKAARNQRGQAQLVWVGVDGQKPSNVLRLSPTATSIDYWPAEDALLITARNEIATLRLQGLRSGRLFRVIGANLSLATLAASDLVLVGQEDALILIDLGDPPGEQQMPFRDRLEIDAPVIELVAAPDGSHALARLADGRVYHVTPWPLEIRAEGSAVAVVAAGKTGNRSPLNLPPPPVVTDPVSLPAATAVGAALSETEVATPPTDAAASAPADQTKIAPPLETSSVTATHVAAPEETVQLWGRITGPSAGDVEELILLGPDSILNEARRVEPDPDGVWRVDGLAPGRYQIQISGGANRVLVSEPSAVVVELGPAGSTEAKTFTVIRSHAP